MRFDRYRRLKLYGELAQALEHTDSEEGIARACIAFGQALLVEQAELESVVGVTPLLPAEHSGEQHHALVVGVAS